MRTNYQLRILLILIVLIGTVAFIQYKYNIFNITVENSNDSYTELFLNTNATQKTVYVEIADSEEEVTKGLMYRENLDDNKGMLFVFSGLHRSPFWMKNCKISLDMIFIDNNRKVVDIVRNAPPCQTDECPVYQSSKEYQYVIEVNGGWADKNGIIPNVTTMEYE